MNLASKRNETLLVLQDVETSVLGFEVFSVFLRGTQVCSGHAGLNKAYPSEMYISSRCVGRAAVARSMHDFDC